MESLPKAITLILAWDMLSAHHHHHSIASNKQLKETDWGKPKAALVGACVVYPWGLLTTWSLSLRHRSVSSKRRAHVLLGPSQGIRESLVIVRLL